MSNKTLTLKQNLKTSNALVSKAIVLNPTISFKGPKSFLEFSPEKQVNCDLILNPCFITGFTQADGCFHISISKNKFLKNGYALNPTFSLTQLYTPNSTLLKQIQTLWGCGSITKPSKRDNCQSFTVKGLKNANNVLIPFFLKYPLLPEKLFDFQKFKKVVELLNQKVHLAGPEGWNRVLQLVYTMNKAGKRTLFLDLKPKDKGLKKEEKEFLEEKCTKGFLEGDCLGSYISGVIQGDGGFCVYLKNKKTLGFCFSLGMQSDSIKVLKLIQSYFNCGFISKIKENYLRLSITGKVDLETRVFPHFEKYPLFEQKALDYQVMVKVIKELKTLGKNPRSLKGDRWNELINFIWHKNMGGKRRSSVLPPVLLDAPLG